MEKRKHRLIEGFGPVCSPELRAVGIRSVEDIRALGWEEAYLRWVARFPGRINVNAAVGMIAAELGALWLKLGTEEKERARRLVGRLRKGALTDVRLSVARGVDVSHLRTDRVLPSDGRLRAGSPPSPTGTGNC